MATRTQPSRSRSHSTIRRVDRRAPESGSSSDPSILVARSLQAAQRQLLKAREDLKAARRRVVELEDVAKAWHAFAGQVAHDPWA